MARIYSRLFYHAQHGTCLEFVCPACFRADATRQHHGYIEPAIRQTPEPGETCAGCKKPL